MFQMITWEINQITNCKTKINCLKKWNILVPNNKKKDNHKFKLLHCLKLIMCLSLIWVKWSKGMTLIMIFILKKKKNLILSYNNNNNNSLSQSINWCTEIKSNCINNYRVMLIRSLTCWERVLLNRIISSLIICSNNRILCKDYLNFSSRSITILLSNSYLQIRSITLKKMQRLYLMLQMH
jgi:hypothetical protein